MYSIPSNSKYQSSFGVKNVCRKIRKENSPKYIYIGFKNKYAILKNLFTKRLCVIFME